MTMVISACGCLYFQAKMSVYESVFGMTPFLCHIWAHSRRFHRGRGKFAPVLVNEPGQTFCSSAGSVHLHTYKMLSPDVFSGPHYAPNSLEAGALPRTPLGKLTTLPRAPKLDREGTQTCGHPFPFPSPLDAIGVSLSVCGTLAPQLAKNCPGTGNGNSAPLAELLFLAHSVEMKPTTSMCVTAMAVCDVSTCLLQSADLSLSVV